MDWFYAQDRTQIGPVSEEEFRNLVETAQITASTLVWCPGMENWLKFEAVASQLGYADTLAEQTSDPVPTPPLQNNVPPEVAAGNDAGVLTQNDAGALAAPNENDIPPEQAERPAETDPAAVPHAAETGDKLPPESHLTGPVDAIPIETSGRMAGMSIRAAAKGIDVLIVCLLGTGIRLLAGLAGISGGSQRMRIGTILVFITCYVLYTVYSSAKYGATPGKRICRLRIVSGGGARMTMRIAIKRGLAELISLLLVGTGFLMAVFDSERRTLHDRIAGTHVRQSL